MIEGGLNMENEEVISLRDILETLLNGKWIIIGITSIFAFFGIIYSFFIANPVYESKATILVSNIEQPIGNLNEYVNNATSTDIVVNVIRSPEVIEKTIIDLNLDRSVSSLLNNLTISTNDANESLIELKLHGSDYENLSNIIDQLIVNTRDTITNRVNTYISSYENLYYEKINEEQQQLAEYLIEYNELEKAYGLPLLVLFQQNASGAEYVLEANEALLTELRELDKATQVEYEQINALINETNNRIKEFYVNYNDAVTAQSLELVEERINVFSDAFTGSNPIKPNKVLNTAVAFVLGLMVSVGIVFFRSYWIETKKENEV